MPRRNPEFLQKSRKTRAGSSLILRTVNNCYDGVHHVQSRVTGVLAALLVAMSAQATPWRAEVAPPRPGLPAVVVEVGYPDGYIPAFNTPVVIHATAGDAGFAGYIGFHFEFGGRSTVDTPVIGSASIRPHETWTFRTIATLHLWNDRTEQSANAGSPPVTRDLVVEWRGNATELLGVEDAGSPPWIIGAAARLPLHVSTTSVLPDTSQWYAGFSSVIVPLATWLDLQPRVREAIFAAPVEVVFVGFARADQTFDELTRTLLPVEFGAGQGSYVAPWPYGAATRSAPVSWTVKRGSGFVGTAMRPYLARTLAATWVADDHALDRPLPSVVHVRARTRFVNYDPRIPDRRPWIWAAIAFLVAVAAWLLVRNNRLVAGGVLAVAFAAMTAMSRDGIRRATATDEYVLKGALAPGVGSEYHLFFDRGPSPLSPAPADRLSVSGNDWLPGQVEIRTNETSPSMGAIKTVGDWALAIRWKIKRTMIRENRSRVVQYAGNDLHSVTLVQNVLANDERSYIIEPALEHLADGRMKMTLALPVGHSDRSARMSLTTAVSGGPVRITWATGSIDLPLSPSQGVHVCAIPADVLRAIDANGGVFEATVTPAIHIVRPVYNVLLHVQEKP